MSAARSAVTTHVLDTAAGRPAAGIAVRLERVTVGQPDVLVARSRTGTDGRVTDLGPERLPPGTYRLVFGTGDYFGGLEQEAFFPEVTVVFVLADPASHYHLPLLLSPFAYSTYRGS